MRSPPPPSPLCLSDLRIDTLLAGDLGDAEARRAREHAGTCPACAARVAHIEAARAAGAASGGPDLEALRRAAALPARAVAAAPQAPRATWGRAWVALGATLAAGAAALALVARAPAPPSGGTRSKGRAHVGFFVEHGGLVRRGGPGEAVSPGDIVRFTTSSAEAAHLAIVGVDAARAATVYFPVSGGADTVPAGTDVELPRATELDATLGPELVYAFFCARPLDPAALEAARAALAARPQAPPELTGCTVDRLDWVKVPAR